jgi:NADH-quinone oxidoreductase subunit I
LNLADPNEALDRWRANCALVELTPQFGRKDDGAAAPGAPAAATADAAAPAEAAAATGGGSSDDDIHVEAQVDQEVYDQLIAEGKSERIARAKAKAAYVRAEKQRIKAEREGGAGDETAKEPASA